MTRKAGFIPSELRKSAPAVGWKIWIEEGGGDRNAKKGTGEEGKQQSWLLLQACGACTPGWTAGYLVSTLWRADRKMRPQHILLKSGPTFSLVNRGTQPWSPQSFLSINYFGGLHLFWLFPITHLLSNSETCFHISVRWWHQRWRNKQKRLENGYVGEIIGSKIIYIL